MAGVQAGRLFVLLEAQTAQFHARMDAAAQQLHRWNSATVSGRRGTMALQQGIQALAFQAAGVTGPVGKAATAIGMLGFGTPLVIGVLAGVTAIATAYKLAAKTANDLTASTEKLNASYRDITASGKPLVAIQNRIMDAVKEQGDAQAKLDKLGSSVMTPRGRATRGTPGEIALAQANVDAAARVVSALRAERAEALADREKALQRENEEAARRRALMRVVPEGPSALVAEGLFARDQARMRGQLSLDIARDEAARTHIRQRGTPPATPGGFQLTPEFAVMSAMALMQGIQSGSAGGFLGAAAGPIAMVNPLAGAITAGLGGVFSLFDNNEDRRHRELIDKLEKMGQEVGLDRVTIVFTGPDGHQIRKSLAELEEGDAVSRVPGPVGAAG